MDIRPIASAPGPQGLDALAASAAPAPTQDITPAQVASAPLDPPVKLDIGKSALNERFVRDLDTSTIVFQVVDPASGDVLDQLPSEAALRNRAYGAAQSKDASAGNLSRVA